MQNQVSIYFEKQRKANRDREGERGGGMRACNAAAAADDDDDDDANNNDDAHVDLFCLFLYIFIFLQFL